MKPAATQERKIRIALYATIISIVALYLSQAAFIHLRLKLMHATKADLNFISESCDEANCTAQWEIVPKQKLLLMGHIMRTHELIKASSNDQVFPISRVRGITIDSWSGLRVYEVTPNSTYKLVATKPKAVKMDYFIGILPRTTDHEGVLSIPDISPTISTMTTMAGFGVLGVLLFAAFLAPQSGVNGTKNREELITIAVSAVAAAIVSAITSGSVDSLMPDGEIRSRILRTCAVFAMLMPAVYSIAVLRANSAVKCAIFSLLLSVVSVNLLWSYFRAGSTWIISYGFLLASLIVNLWVRGHKIAAITLSIAFWDTLGMAGLSPFGDLPPIKVLNIGLIAAFSLITSEIGAISVISLASKAYLRFTRDVSIRKIEGFLDQNESGNDKYSSLPDAVRKVLPLISQLTGAKRVSILINLPLARPITHTYDALKQTTQTHDDGKIPGAVTVRAFVYGDETWFESYSEFAKRLSIPNNKSLSAYEYVCVSPIRVNQNNMGVLMLTSFDDERIKRLKKSGAIDEERESGRQIVDTLANAFSNILIDSLKASSEQSLDLLSQVREAIPACGTSAEFLQRYCQSIHLVTGLRTMLHEWQGDLGVPKAQAGFTETHWKVFAESPLNLNENASKAYGSTVVAFRERKSSYLKDWEEISEKLHPKSVEILKSISAKTFFAIPLTSGSERFVVTLISNKNERPKDPRLMKIIESTEAIFDAAITVLNQRSSVLALGKLANRLIGDDDVRNKIINAAKQEILPTTIGTPRTSFLLLFDLVGSSMLSDDSEEKARSYGWFYDEVNRLAAEKLFGKIRKTIGDAIIVTWDGSDLSFENIQSPIGLLVELTLEVDHLARKIGCSGVRAVFHHGSYFFGLIGTSSFGQIDVIGKGIDEICKMETQMKIMHLEHNPLIISISKDASTRLADIHDSSWIGYGFIKLDSQNPLHPQNLPALWIASRENILKIRSLTFRQRSA